MSHRTSHPARLLASTAVGLAGLVLATSAAGGAAAADVAPQASDRHAAAGSQSATLAALKKQLRPFVDSPAAAEAAGYLPSEVCVESEDGTGAMGMHYFNPEIFFSEKIDPLRPPVLVYVPGDDGRLTLGAAEWAHIDEDQDLSTAEDKPSLFGRPFNGPMVGHEPGQPIHDDLHVWLFEPNPSGVFAPYNPRVHC